MYMLTPDQYDRYNKHKDQVKEEVKQALAPLLEKYPELALHDMAIVRDGLIGLRMSAESYFANLNEPLKEVV